MSERGLADRPIADGGVTEQVWPARVVAAVLVVAALLWVAASNGFGPSSVAAMLPVLTTAAVYAVAATGLNLQFGHGGLLNFGFVAFMAVGAYTTVLLIPHLQGPQSTQLGGVLPLVVAVIVAMVVASLLGLVFAIPAIRLRSDYLAIVMIGLAEIVRVVLKNIEPVSGGVYGMLGFSTELQQFRPRFVNLLAREVNTQGFQLWLVIVSWVCLVLCTVGVALLMKTPWGKMLRAVRDDEAAVRSLGKNPTTLKLQTLMIGGAIGGLAGALLAFQLSQINPDVFMPQVTFFVFAIVIVGGTGTTWGPAVGGIIFWVLLTQTGAFITELMGSNSAASALRYILVGLLMVLIIVFRPQGLLGRRENVVLELK
jgi:neutral amino acid transport system permease protein